MLHKVYKKKTGNPIVKKQNKTKKKTLQAAKLSSLLLRVHGINSSITNTDITHLTIILILHSELIMYVTIGKELDKTTLDQHKLTSEQSIRTK